MPQRQSSRFKRPSCYATKQIASSRCRLPFARCRSRTQPARVTLFNAIVWLILCSTPTCFAASRATIGPPTQHTVAEVERLLARGDSLANSGQFFEASQSYSKARALSEKALGQRELSTILATAKLATSLREQGRFLSAEPIYKQAISLMETSAKNAATNNLRVQNVELVKGIPRDWDYFSLLLIQTTDEVARFYQDWPKYELSTAIYKKAIALRESALGQDAPELATPLNDLGTIYYMLEQDMFAEVCFKRAIAIWESLSKTEGRPLRDGITVPLANLAELRRKNRRYEEAKQLKERILDIRSAAAGDLSPEVFETLYDLKTFNQDLGRFEEAKAYDERYHRALSEAVAQGDPRFVSPLLRLAASEQRKNRFAEAEQFLKFALSIEERAPRPESIDILNRLANLYRFQRRYEDADLLYSRAMALAKDDSELRDISNNVAVNFRMKGQSRKAEASFKKALDVVNKNEGPYSLESARILSNLGGFYSDLGRYGDAKPLLRRALSIFDDGLGRDSPESAYTMNNLANALSRLGDQASAEVYYKRSLDIREIQRPSNANEINDALLNLILFYADGKRYADTVPLLRRAVSEGSIESPHLLAAIYDAQSANRMPADEAVSSSLTLVQRVMRSRAAEALGNLAPRFAAGTGRLADLVRKDQDLALEGSRLQRDLTATFSKDRDKRDPVGENQLRRQILAVEREQIQVGSALRQEFPDYAALSKPQPLPIGEVQALLAEDEATVLIYVSSVGNYVWAITKTEAVWKKLAVTDREISDRVLQLRAGLNIESDKSFEPALSFDFYRKILGPVEQVIRSKARCNFVLTGALASLPPQVFVTEDPSGKQVGGPAWLILRQAITILPSLPSLKVLRGGRPPALYYSKPLIGFAPMFDENIQSTPLLSTATKTQVGTSQRRLIADASNLLLDPLPGSDEEIKEVGKSVGATENDINIRGEATESRVKQSNLEKYRIVYFATHGLLASEVRKLAKLDNPEPALALTRPRTPTEVDDGLLTASEVAQLKMNAEWVVLSACNTAAGDNTSSESFSGLARAFFYAGSQSLMVSHWAVERQSGAEIMMRTFEAIEADPAISHGEALQKSILSMIHTPADPKWASPKYWAPFVVVGEPAKPSLQIQ